MEDRLDEMIYMKDLVEQSCQNLSKYADKLMHTFIDAVMKDTLLETWQIHKSVLNQMEALVNQLGIMQSEEKQRVYYFASVKTILELGNVLCVEIEEQEELQRYKQFKYIYPVLDILATGGSLPLCIIAEKLKISRNSLSNFFGRTDGFYLWNMKKRGREHYYTITAKGKRVYKNYHLQGMVAKKGDTYEIIMINILDSLAKEMRKDKPDFSNILRTLNKKEAKGISMYSSEVIESKLREVNISYELGEEYRRKKRQQEHERRMPRGMETPLILENDSEFIMQNIKTMMEA